VAKILVADDNSNIQKMVVSALKNQGMDVVAVGNGEAAVRKISDVRPDLVLADVFMPVRNGYEVCKYVKADSALSHIPVILLVGAFDPLDEQEAQRVGADGVLKKPFVPPDPLISMVKSALSRAGVNYSGAPPGQEESGERAPSHAAAPPPPPPGAIEESEPFHEPVSKRPAPLTIESGSQPLAFGSLLETPEAQAEDETDYVTPVKSGMVPERNWGVRHEEQDVPEEEEVPEETSWRHTGAEDLEKAPASKADWKGSAFETPADAVRHSEKWTPTTEKPDFVEAARDATSPMDVEEIPAPPINFGESPWSKPPDANIARQREPKVEERAPERFLEKEMTFSAEEFPSEASITSPVSAAQDTEEATVVAEPEKTPEPAAPTTAEPSPWYSVSPNPWDSVALKASQLAATWDSAPPSHPETTQAEEAKSIEAVPHVEEEAPPTVQEELKPAALTVTEPEHPVEAILPAATAEVIREETVQVVEETLQEAESVPVPEETPAPSATKANLDDVVAKVLAKMSPEVLQAVTKEILKPVVEAMVREELNKK
jgi:CheY-like chemotaxis protein